MSFNKRLMMTYLVYKSLGTHLGPGGGGSRAGAGRHITVRGGTTRGLNSHSDVIIRVCDQQC